MPTRKASATWEGGIRDGRGQFNGESGALDARYSFARFEEEGGGTNPEELLAAAEASCYSMALAAALVKQGKSPTRIRTDAACTVEKAGEGYKITRMRLTVRAQVPDLDAEAFQQFAEATKDGCPVSGALKGNVQFELDAALE